MEMSQFPRIVVTLKIERGLPQHFHGLLDKQKHEDIMFMKLEMNGIA